MNHSSFANGFERSTRRTRRPALVVEMLAVAPWGALVDRIAPFNQAGTTGRPTYPVRLLARVHFLQQWFSLVVEAQGRMVRRGTLVDVDWHPRSG